MSSTHRHPPTRQDLSRDRSRRPGDRTVRAGEHALPWATDMVAQEDPDVVERISMAPDNRYLLTPAEAARRLSISRALCYRLISSGEIPSILIGAKLRRVPVHGLESYIEAKLADSTGYSGR